MNKNNSRKIEEDVKAELLRPIKETNEKFDATFHEIHEQVTRLGNAIEVIKQYDKVVMTEEK